MSTDDTAVAERPAATEPPALVPVVQTLRETALARVTATEQHLRSLADKHRNVAFDLAETKGRKAAREAYSELRSARLVVQRAEKETRDELNDLKAVIGKKRDELIAIVEPVETNVKGQIDAWEKAEEERKEREAAAERERVAKHEANIATIRGYVAQAAGRTSAEIASGIAALEALDIGEAWQEFAEQARAALAETLGSLRRLHAHTVGAEQAAAAAAAQARVIQQLQALQREVTEAIGKPAALIEARVLRLQAEAGVDEAPEVAAARAGTLAQLQAMHAAAVQQEAVAVQLAALKAAEAAKPAPDTVAAPTPAPAEPQARHEPAQRPAAVAAPAPAAAAREPAPAPAAPQAPQEPALPEPPARSLEQQLADARAALSDACDLLDEIIKTPVRRQFVDEYQAKVNDLRAFGGIAG